MLSSTNTQPQSLGGKVMAFRQRKNAEQVYLANPNICLFCKKNIPIIPDKPVAQIRQKKFCNSSCAAYFNKNHKPPAPFIPKFCPICHQPTKKNSRCRECYKAANLSKLGIRLKGEIFSQSKSWQAARSTIQRAARLVFFSSQRIKACEVCGYNKHIEICHIKAVSDFSDTSSLSEINHLDNLKPLCPTHHWEFDNLKVGS